MPAKLQADTLVQYLLPGVRERPASSSSKHATNTFSVTLYAHAQ